MRATSERIHTCSLYFIKQSSKTQPHFAPIANNKRTKSIKLNMNSYIILLTVLVAISAANASHLLAPAAPILPAPLAAPALLPAPVLAAPAPILTAPAVIGHHPVLLGHAPVATSTHIGAPIAAHTISRPIATYSTTHTLLGAPLAAPALLARPALPLAAPALAAPLALPAPALPLAAPALLARPALW